MATADGERSCRMGTLTHETRHDETGPASLSETIIEAVATAEGVEPTELDIALYDAVDLEALDTLFDRRSLDGHWRFEFSVGNYVVVVEADGQVTVCECW